MYVHNKASNNRFATIELSIMQQITECPNKKYSDKHGWTNDQNRYKEGSKLGMLLGVIR